MKKVEKLITQVQPKEVVRIFCPNKDCKELMVKVYPWASLNIVGKINPCNKCLNKQLKK